MRLTCCMLLDVYVSLDDAGVHVEELLYMSNVLENAWSRTNTNGRCRMCIFGLPQCTCAYLERWSGSWEVFHFNTHMLSAQDMLNKPLELRYLFSSPCKHIQRLTTTVYIEQM